EHPRLVQVELGFDVALREAVGRSRERNNGRAREMLPQRAKLRVLGPKIVAPARNTVRLVNGKHAHVEALQEL
nr:hypothetical protein [Tanacetum cinerariifolium]